MVNLIKVMNDYKKERAAQNKKTQAEEVDKRQNNAAMARAKVGKPPVIEGASVKLPTGTGDVNLAEEIGVDARGKNLDTDTLDFGDAVGGNRRLIQTEPMITPEAPESIDEVNRIDKELEAEALAGRDPIEVLIREQQKRGTVKTDGTVDFSREAAQKVVMAEIENAQLRNQKTDPDSFNWEYDEGIEVAGEKLLSKSGNNVSNKNAISTLAKNAKYINKNIRAQIPSILEENIHKPEIQRLTNLLTSYGLINNTDGKITIPEKFGNALTLQLIETFNDEIARKDNFKNYNSQATLERESMLLDSELMAKARDAKDHKLKYPKFKAKFDEAKALGRPDIKVEGSGTYMSSQAENLFDLNSSEPETGRPDISRIKTSKTQANLDREFMRGEGVIRAEEKKTARAKARAEADLRYNMVQMGSAFNPDYTRGTLAKGLLDKLVKNPKEVAEGVVAGRGSAGDLALSDKNKPADEIGLISILDQMLWQIAKQQGFLDLIEEVDSVTGLPTESFYMVSPKGEDFFMATRIIYSKLKKGRENVSKARPIIGQVIATSDRTRQSGPISLKAKRDANVTKENRIKDKLGAMPYTVIQERFNFLEKLVLEKKGGLIILSDDGRPVKLANMPTNTKQVQKPDWDRVVKERPPLYHQAKRKFDTNRNIEISGADRKLEVLSPEEEAALNWKEPMKTIPEVTPSGDFYSEHEYASALGLDYDNWLEAFYGGMETAQANGVTDEIELQDYGKRQANAVMRDKAGEVYRDYQEAQTETTEVYYNKWMHASSVGRYFMRQQVLNGMNSKAVRNIVGSAMPRRFNLGKPMSNARPHAEVDSEAEIFDAWKVIIGANLLGSNVLTEYKGQRTSKMNWDSILERTNAAFKGGMKNSTYSSWVEKGRKLREFTQTGNVAPLSNLSQFLSPSDLNSFQKKSDEWGFKLQSYIDMANYHDAKQNKGTFKALAQASADGIQSGLTIQSLQNGDLDVLKLVGLIYNDDNNILPLGDIREKFWSQMDGTAEVAFAHDEDKISFWNDFINAVNDSENRESIIKELAKQPLMETSYGRSIKFNHQAINKFLLANGEVMQKALEKNKTFYYNEEIGQIAMVRDFNHLMGLGLLRTLDYGHQKTLSNTGLVWSWLDMNGFYEGPLGTYMFFGSREVVPTGNEIEMNDDGTTFTIKEMKSQATGSAPSSPKVTYDPDTGQMVKSEPSRYGQEVANQIVVLPTQAVDGAVMGNTIDKVNTPVVMEYNGGYPLFVFPVHDSITCDCNSMRQYYETINSELVSLNKEWKQPRAIVNGLLEGLQMQESKIKNDERYTLTSNQTGIEGTNTHRALHNFFLQIDNALKEEGSLEISTQAKLEGKTTSLAGKRRQLLEDARDLGWDPAGGLVTGRQLKQLIHLGMRHLNVVSELKDWEKGNVYNRNEHLGKISRKPSNYQLG